jgi:autotransporter-associated beta strand protein
VVVLSGENTYGGSTNVVGGTLKLNDGNNRLPVGTTIQMGLSNVSGILDLNGNNQEVAGIEVTQSSGTYTNEIKSTAAATLTVNSAAASSYSGTITGVIGLSKSGSDTLTLTATNTYTGDTTIKAGTLALGASGTIADSGNIIVGDAGSTTAVLDVSAKTSGISIGGAQTLSGIGTVDANTSATLGGGDGTKYTVTMANGAIHAVGNATANDGIGTQTVDGNLTYSAGSIFEWDLNGNTADSGDRGDVGGYDGVDGTGALVVNDTENTGTIFKIILGTGVDFEDAFWSTPNTSKTWSNIFSGFTGLTGGFHTSNIDIVGAPENLATIGSFTITGTSLTFTAVPEPTSALVGLLIGAGLLRRRRVA